MTERKTANNTSMTTPPQTLICARYSSETSLRNNIQIPRMRDCDGFQQGRQSGRQNHTLSFLTLCVLHERGRGTSLFLSRWMQRIMWLFSCYLSKLCSLSLISRLSPTNTSLHFSDLSPSLESQSLHLCSDLSYLGDSQNKLYTQKQQLEKL